MASSKIDLNSIKKLVTDITVPTKPELQSLTNEVFTGDNPEYVLIREASEPEVSIEKRCLSYHFKEPLFIHKIKLNTKGLTLKKFRLLMLGAPENSNYKEISAILPSSSDTIIVDSIIHGFELSSSKAIKNQINHIQIIGSKNLTLSNALSLYDQNQLQIEESKNLLNQAIDFIETRVAELESNKEYLLDLETQTKAKELENKSLGSIVENLNTDKNNIGSEIQTMQREKDDLSKDILTRKGHIDELQFKSEDLRHQVNEDTKKLNNVKGEKSLYNETLSGHKKETSKQIALNVSILFGFLLLLAVMFSGAIWLIHEAIVEVKSIESIEKLKILMSLRIGGGFLIYMISKNCLQKFQAIFSKTYALIEDRRTIEGKLILARAIAESSFEKIDIDPSEKREYASFLAFSVLKNHFLNMSLDSIAHDLEIDAEKLSKQLEKLPSKFFSDNFVKEFIHKKQSSITPLSTLDN